jgi:ubiquitin carboxyl-terminal hydrolase 1
VRPTSPAELAVVTPPQGSVAPTFMLDVVRRIVASTPWEQILPLLIVFILAPLLALGTYHRAGSAFPWLVAMLFENLGLGFVWSWVYNHDAPSSTRAKKSSRKKHMRRADQVAAKPESKPPRRTHVCMRATLIFVPGINENERYYPGLVNISGTYCFLNSTLQVCSVVATATLNSCSP